MKSKYFTIAVLLALSFGLYAFIGQDKSFNSPSSNISLEKTENTPNSNKIFRGVNSTQDSLDNVIISNNSLIVPKATNVSWHFRQ